MSFSRRSLLSGAGAVALASPARSLTRDQISHLLNYRKPITYDPSFLQQIPPGAVGLWPFDSLRTSPRAYVPNLLDQTAPTLSLIGPGRRAFSNASFWFVGGGALSIADATATAPDGSSDATVITQASGNWYLTPTNAEQSGTNLPNGTYTVGVNVKWLGSGSPQFRLGNQVGGQTTTYTATSSWQRFAVTFSITGPTNGWVLLWSPDGTLAVNFAICDMEVYAGSADLGPTPVSSHIYFAPTSPGNSAPSVSNALVDLSAGANTAYFQTRNAVTLGPFSVVWASKRVAAGYNNSYQPALTSMIGTLGWTKFSVGADLSDQLGAYLNGSNGSLLGTLHAPSDMDGTSRGLAVFCVNYDGAYLYFYADGVLLGKVAASNTSFALKDFYVNCLNVNYYGGSQFGHLALYARALSTAEVANVTALFAKRLALRGNPVGPARIVLFEGDSITYGVAASIPNNGWAALAAQNCSPSIRAINTGVAGTTLSTLTGRTASDDALAAGVSAPNGGRKPILHLMIGTNDLGAGNAYAGNPTGYATAVQSYLNARRATGYYAKIVLGTLISRGDQSDGGIQFDSDRASYNAAIRGWIGSTIDAASDFAANSTMGANGAATNATYFNAKLHPTDAGYALMAPIAQAAINPLWNY